MNGNYWDRTLRKRLSRRRALIGGGGAVLGSAFILACGGEDDDDDGGSSSGSPTGSGSSSGSGSPSSGGSGSGGSSGAASGLLTQAEDTTSSAKPGGVWPHYIWYEASTLDPTANASAGSGLNLQGFNYSRLFQWEPGILENPIGGAYVPDAAESFEVSDDGLTLTFTLRQDMKFDPRPPTNGRAVTPQDVEFSWNRFSELGLTRFDYVHSLSPAGPVESITAIDDKTVQAKLAFPIANMASRFAFHRFLSILPTEADGGFDTVSEARGSGPWRLRQWEPSIGYTFDKNDEWHLRDGQPFIDTIEMKLITEPAQRRAQLEAGALWHVLTGPFGLPPREILDAKKSQPGLALYDNGYPWGGPSHITFGFRGESPFHDERIRRAASMVIDRDLWIRANYDVELYESEGLPQEVRWNSHYSADDAYYWLDPQGTELGEGAAFFQYNLEEATKLMQAAGFEPLQTAALFRAPGNDQITSLHGLLQDSGLFDLELQSLPPTDHSATVWNSMGDFEGIALDQNMGVRGDIDQYLSTRWSPGGASGTQSMFPEVYPWYQRAQDLLNQQRQELDEEKRLGIILDLEREYANIMPTVPYPGAANQFTVAWPRLANFGVFKSVYDDEAVWWTRLWHDESKA